MVHSLVRMALGSTLLLFLTESPIWRDTGLSVRYFVKLRPNTNTDLRSFYAAIVDDHLAVRPIPPEITYNNVGFLPPHIAANVSNIPPHTNVRYSQQDPQNEYYEPYRGQHVGHIQYYNDRPPHFERDLFEVHPSKVSMQAGRFQSNDSPPFEMSGSMGITRISSMAAVEHKADPI